MEKLLKDYPAISLISIHHQEHVSNTKLAAYQGLPGNVNRSVALLHGLAQRVRNQGRPIHILLGGSDVDNLDNLADYADGTYHHVSLFISSLRDNNISAVGFCLGYLATLPVQRKLSRVRNGALPISKAQFTNGLSAEDGNAFYESLHNKRYLFLRTYPGRTGYYFTDDLTLSSNSNDYSTIAANRVINKLIRISQALFVNEIGQEVLVEENGSLAPATARYYEELIENAINLQMTAQGELSNVKAFVDENQKVLQTDELSVQLEAQPVGYTNTLKVNIGFALDLDENTAA